MNLLFLLVKISFIHVVYSLTFGLNCSFPFIKSELKTELISKPGFTGISPVVTSFVLLNKYYTVSRLNISVFDVSNRNWTVLQLPFVASHASTVAVGSVASNSFFFSIGTSTAYFYNLSTLMWGTIRLSIGRNKINIISVRDLVIFSGGCCGSSSSSAVDIYNTTSKISQTTAFSSPRAFMGSAYNDNKVVFAGGSDGTFSYGFSNTVDIFGVTNFEWKTALLSDAIIYPLVISHGNLFFVIGGYVSSADLVSYVRNSLDVYDTISDSWRKENILYYFSGDFMSISKLGCKLFIVSFTTRSGDKGIAYSYDVVSGEFAQLNQRNLLSTLTSDKMSVSIGYSMYFADNFSIQVLTYCSVGSLYVNGTCACPFRRFDNGTFCINWASLSETYGNINSVKNMATGYLGCFVDGEINDMGPKQGVIGNSTIVSVRQKCQLLNFTFFGISNDGDIYCSNSFGTDIKYYKADDSECKLNSSIAGRKRNSIYLTIIPKLSQPSPVINNCDFSCFFLQPFILYPVIGAMVLILLFCFWCYRKRKSKTIDNDQVELPGSIRSVPSVPSISTTEAPTTGAYAPKSLMFIDPTQLDKNMVGRSSRYSTQMFTNNAPSVNFNQGSHSQQFSPNLSNNVSNMSLSRGHQLSNNASSNFSNASFTRGHQLSHNLSNNFSAVTFSQGNHGPQFSNNFSNTTFNEANHGHQFSNNFSTGAINEDNRSHQFSNNISNNPSNVDLNRSGHAHQFSNILSNENIDHLESTDGWTTCTDDSGNTYYYNEISGISQWESPY